jgi:hypothetical protein
VPQGVCRSEVDICSFVLFASGFHACSDFILQGFGKVTVTAIFERVNYGGDIGYQEEMSTLCDMFSDDFWMAC